MWIIPRPGNTIRIGRYEFSQAVPLAAGTQISFGASTWQIEKPHNLSFKPRSLPLTAAIA